MRAVFLFLKKRMIHQFLFSILINPYMKGFYSGTIYQGTLKKICVPVLNCYSCPGAVMSCPIGTLQHMIAYFKYNFSLIVAGTLMVIGSISGRWVCGHMCPFGLVQDVLARIIRKKYNPSRFFYYIPWLLLGIFTVILPLLTKNPTFCKYICPQGMFQGGLWLPFFNDYQLGWLYASKITILLIILAASIFIVRPFCRYICPLGLVLGLFNTISLFRMNVDKTICISCDRCKKVCPMDIEVYKTPDSSACIRCLDCIPACPVSCISFSTKSKEVSDEKNSN